MIDVSEENLKDLKSTLAAATFLTRCQFVTQDKLKQELNNAFQGFKSVYIYRLRDVIV